MQGDLIGPTSATFYGSTSIQSPLSFTGTTQIGASYFGGAILTGAGALTASQVINASANLSLVYSQGSVNRVSDTAAVNVQSGGSLALTNTGTLAASEILGVVTIGSTQNPILLNVGSTAMGQMNVTIDSLIRTGSSTASIAFGANSTLSFKTAPAQTGGNGASGTTTRSIVPWMIGAASGTTPTLPGFVTIDNNTSRLLTTNEYETTLSEVPATANVRVTSPQTLTAATTVNSLIANDAGTIDTAGQALNVTSGAVLFGNSSAASTGTFTAIAGGGTLRAPTEMIVRGAVLSSGKYFIIDTPIVADSLTVPSNGNAVMVFNQPSSIANSTTVSGYVVSQADGALGTGSLNVLGGNLTIANVSQTLGGTSGMKLTGGIISVSGGLTATVRGPLSATSFELRGNGTFEVAADSPNVTGTRIGYSGVLRIDGVFGSTLPITMESQYLGTLTGKATNIYGSVVGGDIEPGLPVGTMTVLSILPSGADGRKVIGFDLAGNGSAVGIDFDQLIVKSLSSFQNYTLDVRLDNNFVPTFGETFDIVRNLSGQAFASPFVGLPEGSLFTVNGTQFQIDYLGGTSGFDVVLTAVPEPAITMSFVTGFASIGMLRRKRMRLNRGLIRL